MDQEEFFRSPLSEWLTLRDLAAELRVSVEVVRRAVERVHIAPRRRHGVVRLWGRDQAEAVRAALAT